MHWGWALTPGGWDVTLAAGDPQVKLFILDLSALLASLPQAKPAAPAPQPDPGEQWGRGPPGTSPPADRCIFAVGGG